MADIGEGAGSIEDHLNGPGLGEIDGGDLLTGHRVVHLETGSAEQGYPQFVLSGPKRHLLGGVAAAELDCFVEDLAGRVQPKGKTDLIGIQ